MVYVDDYRAFWRGMLMSHMMADSEAELLAMAESCGLAGRHIQRHPLHPPHFDVCERIALEVVSRGGRRVSCRELVRHFSTVPRPAAPAQEASSHA